RPSGTDRTVAFQRSIATVSSSAHSLTGDSGQGCVVAAISTSGTAPSGGAAATSSSVRAQSMPSGFAARAVVSPRQFTDLNSLQPSSTNPGAGAGSTRTSPATSAWSSAAN